MTVQEPDPAAQRLRRLSPTQIGELEAELAALTEEFGDDPLAAIDEQIAQRQADRESLLAQMQPAIDRGYDPGSPSRLNELEWGGTLDAFVHTTLVSGRPYQLLAPPHARVVADSRWPTA